MFRKERILKITKSDFFKNLSVQVTGTFIAQLIPIIASFFLSRLYNQEAFGVLALFMAIIGVLNVPNSGRFFLPIVKAADDKEANELYQLCILTTLTYNIFLFLVILVSYSYLNKIYKLDSLWYYIPLYVLLFGFYNAGLFYSVRKKAFLKNAKAKIVQTLLGSIVSILVAYIGFLYFGLVVGRFVGLFFSVLILFKFLPKKLVFSDLKDVAIKYVDYPKLTILPTVLNIFSLQALVFYVGLYFSEETLGYLGLANMILVAPIALIGMSFRDVFYQKISELYNNGMLREAKNFFLKSTVGLSIIGVLLSLIIFLFGDILFKFFYGNEWEKSGIYASILVFAIAIKLVVSPLSLVLNTTNNIKWQAIWQTTYFVTLNLTLYLSIVFFDLSFLELIKIYTLHELLMYTIYFLIQYKSLNE